LAAAAAAAELGLDWAGPPPLSAAALKKIPGCERQAGRPFKPRPLSDDFVAKMADGTLKKKRVSVPPAPTFAAVGA
jgi:hypothetical protein